MARFLRNMLRQDLGMIDGMLQAERMRRDRQAQERTPQERLQQMPFLEPEVKEEKRYGEELEERKENDILTKPSSIEFIEALKPEIDENVSKGQNEIETQLVARSNYTRPFSNKISLVEEPLEPKPRIKLEVPKPGPCEDQPKVQPAYECALDQLRNLDKAYKDKNFRFYGKYFRSTHASVLNFFKYRKTIPVGHPHERFNVEENSFTETYCELFFEKPTLVEVYHMKTNYLWM